MSVTLPKLFAYKILNFEHKINHNKFNNPFRPKLYSTRKEIHPKFRLISPLFSPSPLLSFPFFNKSTSSANAGIN